jgi:fumarate hydratase class II
MFEKYCIAGLEANKKRIKEYVENSLMLVTALSPVIGYDACAKLAHTAYQDGSSLKEACLKLGLLSAKEFDKIVVPEKMTYPNS